jgi:hypothetical protein
MILQYTISINARARRLEITSSHAILFFERAVNKKLLLAKRYKKRFEEEKILIFIRNTS